MLFDRIKRQGARAVASRVRRAATAVVEAVEARQHMDASFGTATALGPVSGLVVKLGSVNTSGDQNDYYKFSLAQAGRLRVSLDGNAGDADLYLYNAANLGNQIGVSTNGNTTELIDKANVPAGTYYARVNAQGAGTTNYTLGVQTDFAGNTKAAARVLGTIGTTEKVYNDFIGNSDKEDWYKFSTAGNGMLTVKLEGLSKDVDLQLYNSSGTLLKSSALTGNQSEIIFHGTGATTYYVRAYQFASTSNYTLKIKNAVVPADGAGNTLGAAKNLNTLGGTATFSDHIVNIFDSVDLYKFFVAEKGNIEVKLTGLKADLDLELLDVNGNVTAISNSAGRADDAITKLSNFGGTYYVRVKGGSGDLASPYNLSITAPKDGGPNTRALAKQLTVTGGAAVANGFVGVNDKEDWYKISVAAGKDIQATLTGLSADADIQLVNSGGTVIDSSTFGSTTSEVVDATSVSAGTYYFRVYNFKNNNAAYKLDISVT